jgi:hypothetical protein
MDQSLYPHARLVWKLVDWSGGFTLMAANTLVELAGDTEDREDLMRVIQGYYLEVQPYSGWLGRALNIRISTDRLLALHDRIRQSEKDASHASKDPLVPEALIV